ncbi:MULTISPECIES: hypothetical protein [Antarcticibacterium]|nr:MULTISPECIES: hypothetical protein [Antarcticibacterium]
MILLYLLMGLQVLVVLFGSWFLIRKIRNYRKGKAENKREF